MAPWKSWLMELGKAAALEGGYEAPFWATTGSSDPPPDAGPDAGTDSGADSGPDAGTDDAGITEPPPRKDSGDDGG